jgi:hypothetical protein
MKGYKKMRRIAGFLVCGILSALLLAGCGSFTAPAPAPALTGPKVAATTPGLTGPAANGLLEYAVLPGATDRAIDDWRQPHFVTYNPAVPSKNKLFVFLGGSFGIPAHTKDITREAANQGFNAINLRYPNSWTVYNLCARDSDRNCFENVREEIFDGQDRTNKVNITPANSLQNRLEKLLVYLARQHPGQGWAKFLDGSNIRWDSTVIAGHSQGGGEAMTIAHFKTVSRVVMFGAPSDSFEGGTIPSPGITADNATPASAYYAFTHTKDPGLRMDKAAWTILGMDQFGPLVNVDVQQPPFNGSHELTTGVTPVIAGRYHGSVVVDGDTPLKADSTPLFAPVWDYLCFS